MFLEEFFVKNKPKPWMLIVAGNLMVGMAMYLRGEPMIKITEDVQGSPADVQRRS